MPDKFDVKTRSRIMSKIRHKNTKPELRLRAALCSRGLRGYRLHLKLPGKPDVTYTKKRVAIFVDGDFWHGYSWKKLGKVPPRGYWQKKIQSNIDRAKRHNMQLKKEGWAVLRFWEHEINSSVNKCVNKISKLL